MGGGIFYHIPTYEKLGLKVPTTWDELMANSAVIAEKTDQAPIIQTYGDSWTSQLPVLANNFNVLAENPDFAEEYTNNAAKFATTPAALEGFERLQDIAASGYLNEDFGAATLEDGMQMVATGKGVHYPMLTFALGTVKQNNPDELNDIGFFAQPGDDAEKNGLTIWMSQAVYIPKTSDKVEAAKGFVDFMATEEACELIVATNGATGPYLIDGCDLPADVPTAVADMLPYFEKANGTAPALEYLSPIKGPALQQLTVEVGSGIRDAKSAAELYDKDVAKQARQLGLPNW